MNKIVTIYIDLPEEESPTLCKTKAIDMGNSLYKVLPTPHYDPEDQVWEFLPGSIVRCIEKEIKIGKILLAVEKVG